MNEKEKIPVLLFQLLLHPLRTIKGIHLINYDKDMMDKLFYFCAAIIGSGSILLRGDRGSIGLAFFGLILSPILAFVGRWGDSFKYFMLIKIIGRIDVSFDIVKIVFYPIIALELLLRFAVYILFSKIVIATGIASIIFYLWIKALGFLIMRYKMKQSVAKSITLTIILICFEGLVLATLTLL